MFGNCNCSHFHGHFILRWILGLLILAIVFAFGVKIGELKSGFAGSGFGHYRSQQFQGYPRQYRTMPLGSGIMGASGAPATSTTTK